ncbi:adenosylcobinamide-GDP ribazoletransferase [Pseudooceanicola aestuarii]|uniref:adenosylcobinamide-GDP ribazoletransferase n=1 Tax=Pseudooceanicola aestuarii TaxID=2697319 RepID=UPI0013D51A59|nr:adenosylcobinamide-GDP ribazoletransferase [Pseudooceanicola aestuarii]
MTPARYAPADLLAALGLLSRLPLPDHAPRGAGAAWAYPLAGLVLGALAALAGMLALRLGLPSGGAAIVVLGLSVWLTGALHEDGLADCADGFGVQADRARRLEIMRDSRLGSYGAVALMLALLARWYGLTLVLAQPGGGWAVLGVFALSRSAMVPLMAVLPFARADGLARGMGRVRGGDAALAVGLGLAVVLATAGLRDMLAAGLLAGVAVLALAVRARRLIGGQTGDVLGAAQQVAEIAILAALMV